MADCTAPGCHRTAAFIRTKFGTPLCAPCYQRRNREVLGVASKDDAAMFIYFVQAQDGCIKIGRASNVEKRIAELQTGQAHRLRTLLILSGSASLEFQLHSRFSHLRVRDDGEWFVAGRDLLAFIADPQMPVVRTVEVPDPQLELEL